MNKTLKIFLKRFKLIILAVILYGITFFVNQEIFFKSLETLKVFLIEMAEILPAVLIITSLLSVYVPSDVIIKHFGEKSGIKGKFISFIIGSVSAGPIYAAFPVSLMLFRKGASISNIIIILSSWAVVKVPMLLVEIKFLGFAFALVRYILTVSAILLMSFFLDKIIKRDDISSKVNMETEENEKVQKILDALPKINCRRCGYNSCVELAKAISQNKEELSKCVAL